MTRSPDPYVLPDADLAALLRTAPWRRIVAMGDSIAEGVREPVAGYRDLSWIDRIAEALRAATGAVEVHNLGRRGLVAADVRAQQLDRALALAPDLAIVTAGGNDALGPGFDPDVVDRELDAMVGALRAAGADVLMTELLDITAAPFFPAEHRDALDARMRPLADLTRGVAARHGALLIPMRAHPACAQDGVYSSDRLHLNARGHAIVGTEGVRVLGDALPLREVA